MIKFFRKIRYGLLDKNKTGKNFKYAIGVVVFVLIGILIALQINNWNENRQSNKFSESIDYQLTNIERMADSIYWATAQENREPTLMYLFEVTDSTKNLYKIATDIDPVSDFSYQIFELNNSGLDGVDKIINIQLYFLACCSSIDSYYLIFKNSGEIIELPTVEYFHCDGPQPIKEYRFPNQKYGLENKIIQTVSYRNESWEVDSVAIERVLQLNDLTPLTK